MTRNPLQFLAPFALAGGFALASVPAHATFVIDTSCGVSKCSAGIDFFIDDANSDATTFTGTVGGHKELAVTVDTTGAVETGAGFADIKPFGSAILNSLTFTPANDALFNDFSFRGQLERPGFTGTVDIAWTDSSGMSGTLTVMGVKGPSADFDRIGIVSTDGETLKSVTISTPGSESFKEVKQVEFSSASIIPEPSTYVLMLLGFAGMGYAGLHKAKSARRDAAIA
jgi:hypothetical protein